MNGSLRLEMTQVHNHSSYVLRFTVELFPIILEVKFQSEREL